MEKLRELFYEKNITWKKLIIYSVVIAIISALCIRLPFIKDTSISDISVTFDLWIIFALIIILNSKNVKDAILKTFVFFLISQPLIYLFESLYDCLFNNMGFIETFKLYINNYYIHGPWLLLTFLVIPGSYIAYLIKKDNIISSLVLSVASSYYCYIFVSYLFSQYHYLSAIFCLLMVIILPLILFKNKKNKLICYLVNIIAIIVTIIICINNNKTPIVSNELIDFDYEIKEVSILDEDVVSYQIDDKTLDVKSGIKVGETKLIVTDINDNIYEYNVILNHDEFSVILIK